MPIAITCQCGGSFRVKDELAGRQVKCPKCGQAINVGGQAAAAPSGPLGIDDLIRLASAPGEPPESSKVQTSYPLPISPRSAADYSAEPAGTSPVIIGVVIAASLLMLGGLGVGVVYLLRAS